MRVLETETVVEFLANIGAAIAVGVGQFPNRRNGEHERSVALGVGGARKRQYANRDVQAVGERRDFARAAIGSEIGENAHAVGAVFGRLGRRRGGAEGEVVVVPVFLKRSDW